MPKPAPRPFARKRASLFPPVIGCDEVGRGALCGPVVVAAVWFEPEALPKGLLAKLDDSKRIDRAERETLYPLILKVARVRFAARSARHIDVHNIRQATLQAMLQAVVRLELDAPVRIDGIDVPHGLSGDAQAVVKGDGKVPQIAAASILAKVLRDRLMVRLGLRHPAYHWHANAGYGTRRHRDAIVDFGHTHHHRKSFGDLFDILNAKAPYVPSEVEGRAPSVAPEARASTALSTNGELAGGERLVAQPTPNAQCLDGLEGIVDA